MDKIPLNYEASEGDTHKQTTATLPSEVVQCLENARFLHLATCSDNVPHVSLMNYTYLPSSPYNTLPVIVMTTNPSSRKTTSIRSNPNVSLLVHDWVSHRHPTHARRQSATSPTTSGPPAAPSSLASLLLNLNSSEISSISATIGGAARIARTGSEEEKFFCDKHLENHTYEEGVELFRQDTSGNGGAGAGGELDGNGTDGGAVEGNNNASQGRTAHFMAGGDVSVIVVEIKDVRISDWKGTVRDWAIVPVSGLVNGTH